MTSIRHLAFVMAVLLLADLPRATAQDDYALFSDRAGSASLLYRGHKAYEYALLYNGTYYWSSPDFQTGTVVYNGKAYRDILLNIDAARQDLVVRVSGVSYKLIPREHVQECAFGGRQFLNLQYLYGETAPSGYWEVLYAGRAKVLQRVTKRLEQDLDGRKREETHYDGPFRMDIYQAFIYSADYCYISEDGEIVPLKRRSDVLKLFDKSRRRDVRRHVRQREGGSRLPFDRYCVEVLNYVESR